MKICQVFHRFEIGKVGAVGFVLGGLEAEVGGVGELFGGEEVVGEEVELVAEGVVGFEVVCGGLLATCGG